VYSSSQGCHTATRTHMPYGITVLPATRQRWHSRPYPSRRLYSIKRSRRDARLSWPSWLVTYRDGIPARRRSPIQVLTGPTCVNFVHATNAANHYATPPTVINIPQQQWYWQLSISTLAHQWIETKTPSTFCTLGRLEASAQMATFTRKEETEIINIVGCQSTDMNKL